MKSAHKSESAPWVLIASSAQSLQEAHKEPKGRLPRLRAGSDQYPGWRQSHSWLQRIFICRLRIVYQWWPGSYTNSEELCLYRINISITGGRFY